MALYLKNKKKIETIFEKGFTIKGDGLLFKGYDFKDDEIKQLNFNGMVRLTK